MLPVFFLHSHRIFEKVTEILQQSNGTFLFKGAWFSNMDMLFTSDPANMRHVMSTNFSNFPKGSQNKRFFDIFGDMLFNADLEEWRIHRKVTQGFFNHELFRKSVNKINRNATEKELIPVLNHLSNLGLVVDLQDLFERFMLDATCMLVTGCNPRSLSVDFPDVPFSEAMNDANEAILMRHIVPERIWKLQRWLGVGREKKLSRARKTLDSFAAKYITMNQQQLSKGAKWEEEEGQSTFNTLQYLMCQDAFTGSTPEHAYNVMRDSIIALLFAGRDTSGSALAWFFWLVSKNPSVESKIREELERNLPVDKTHTDWSSNVDVLNKLVYLHGTLCETLRLFPPTPSMRRVPIKPDILPSGHCVNPKMKVVLSSFAMGRMASIWGHDCLEFKPERWISDKGRTNLESSNKFLAFSTGPRICPGKELAFIRMKGVVATIIHNYHVQVMETSDVTLARSFMLRMKHGLMARVTKRVD